MRGILLALGRALWAVALLALLVAPGCRFGPEPDLTITLTWWVTYAEESPEYAALEAIANDYAEGTEYVVVEVVPVPWDDVAPRGIGYSQLQLAQQEGSGPDIWGPVPHSWTGAYALSEQAKPLDPEQINGTQQTIELALHACQYDGQQYGVPILMDSLALIYNTDLVPEPPKSFEELIEVAQELTDPEQDTWGLMLPLLSEYHVYPFIDGYGGYIFGCNDEGCNLEDIGLNNEGAVLGIQLLSDLYLQDGLLSDALADSAQMYDAALEQFASGRAGMLIEGSWTLPEIQASGIPYDVAEIPPLPGTTAAPRPLTLIQALFVNPESAHADETQKLLNHLVSAEAIPQFQSVLGRVPVRRDVLRSAPFRNDRELRVWREQASNGIPLPNVPELGYIWYPWSQALQEAIPGYTPVQDALDTAVEQIKNYIEQDDS